MTSDNRNELEALAMELAVKCGAKVDAPRGAFTLTREQLTAFAARLQPARVPEGWSPRRIVSMERGFEFDSELRAHTPTLLIKFRAVSSDNSDPHAPGWMDRDELAALLATAAAPAPEATNTDDVERAAMAVAADWQGERESVVPWAELPEKSRELARAQVRVVLAAVGNPAPEPAEAVKQGEGREGVEVGDACSRQAGNWTCSHSSH